MIGTMTEIVLGLLGLASLLAAVWLFGEEHGHRRAIEDRERARKGQADGPDT